MNRWEPTAHLMLRAWAVRATAFLLTICVVAWGSMGLPLRQDSAGFVLTSEEDERAAQRTSAHGQQSAQGSSVDHERGDAAEPREDDREEEEKKDIFSSEPSSFAWLISGSSEQISLGTTAIDVRNASFLRKHQARAPPLT
jgi:hypothetical protein